MSQICAFLDNLNGLFIPLDLNLRSQSTMLTPACTQNGLLKCRQPGHLTVSIWVGFLSFLHFSLSCASLLYYLSALGKRSSGPTSVNPEEIHWLTQPPPSVRQSTFQNAQRPVVDFPLVGCQSIELQDIGCS